MFWLTKDRCSLLSTVTTKKTSSFFFRKIWFPRLKHQRALVRPFVVDTERDCLFGSVAGRCVSGVVGGGVALGVGCWGGGSLLGFVTVLVGWEGGGPGSGQPVAAVSKEKEIEFPSIFSVSSGSGRAFLVYLRVVFGITRLSWLHPWV